MRNFNQESTGIILSGEEKEKALSAIHTMLWMSGDCNEVNKLVDGTGNLKPAEINKTSWEDVDSRDYGYIVYTGSGESLLCQLNGVDENSHGCAITVLMLDVDGSAAATFDMASGEVKLLTGTLERFAALVEDYTQAW